MMIFHSFKVHSIGCNRRLISSTLSIARSYSSEADNSSTSEAEVTNPNKSVNVAVIGAPNVGKSSFINAVMNRRICPTSHKVHTTQTRAGAISSMNGIQMKLIDTPGMTTVAENLKYNIGEKFLNECFAGVKDADLIAVVHDVSNSNTRNVLHTTVLQTLVTYKTIPSILVLNKVDQVPPKRILLDLARILTEGTISSQQRKYMPWRGREDKFSAEMSRPVKYKNKKPAGWPYFEDVFMISALNGDGIGFVRDYLMRRSVEREWTHAEYYNNDQSVEKMILDNIRAVCLDVLPNVIPYTTTFDMEYLEIVNKRLIVQVNVRPSKSRFVRVVRGKENKRIEQITDIVRANIRALYSMDSKITLNIVDPDPLFSVKSSTESSTKPSTKFSTKFSAK